ncbi:MAG: hypothetical protein OXN84_01975 [Albidovulum sp.]|nr:hypothetical protein [Albidovulum sp.]
MRRTFATRRPAARGFRKLVADYAAQQGLAPDPAAPFTQYLMRLSEQSGPELVGFPPDAANAEDSDERGEWMTTSRFTR